MSEPKWLELAKGELGTKETAGSNDNPSVMKYYADAGFPGIDHDEVPWCAAFTNAMLKRSGFVGTRSLAARSFEKYGSKLDGPKVGCIAVFPRGGNSWEGHVGIVAEVGSTHVQILGGNQKNSVCYSSYPISKAIAWRWPTLKGPAEIKKPAAEEKPGPAPMKSKDVIAISRKATWLARFTKAFHAIWSSLSVASVLAYFGVAKETIDSVEQVIQNNAIALMIGGAILGAIVLKYVLSLMTEDVNDGRYTPSGESETAA